MQGSRLSFIRHKATHSGTGRPSLILHQCSRTEKAPSSGFPLVPAVDRAARPSQSMLLLPVYVRSYENEAILSPLLFLPVPHCPLVVKVFRGCGRGNGSHSVNELKSYPTLLINTGTSGPPAEDCQLDFTK